MRKIIYWTATAAVWLTLIATIHLVRYQNKYHGRHPRFVAKVWQVWKVWR